MILTILAILILGFIVFNFYTDYRNWANTGNTFAEGMENNQIVLNKFFADKTINQDVKGSQKLFETSVKTIPQDIDFLAPRLRFEDKVTKIQQGDDLLPTVMKVVKVFVDNLDGICLRSKDCILENGILYFLSIWYPIGIAFRSKITVYQ